MQVYLVCIAFSSELLITVLFQSIMYTYMRLFLTAQWLPWLTEPLLLFVMRADATPL